ncbi:MAG: tripartite tricarboxylate transporter substrate binding protein [Betaproteobacteria bacterium]|nr:tripartite tricarboxylate transporter substrate binding protein [Betaproteobacteria bacterium]
MKRIAFAAAAVAFSAAALAQSYPSRPVTIIAPASPGGNIDVTSRILAPALHEILGQPFVVENRPGAGGKIGATAALKAAPDGYTLMMGTSSTLSVGPNVYKEWPVDPVKGITPISLVQQVPFALVVNVKSPYKTVADVLKQTKAKQGGMQMAHAGPGSSNHLVSELFQMLSGAKFLFVAYKGGAPAMASVVSGETEVYFDQASTSVIQIKAGRIRALAVTAEERFAPMPDVPTFDEAGIKGFHVMNVTGLVGPAGMPQAVVQRLNEATVKALKDPKVQERMKGIGAMIVGSTPQAFGKWIRGDLERWKKVVKEAKVPQL